jgi:hypothetical protein
MIKKEDEVGKYGTIINRVIAEVRCLPDLFHRFKRSQKLKLLQEKLKVKVLNRVWKKPFLPNYPCCKTGNLHRIAGFH